MIKKLRRKFIWIIMLIVVFMIFVIMGLTLDMTRTSLEEESLSILRSAGFQDKKEPRPYGDGKEPKPTTILPGQNGTVEGAETSGQTDNGGGGTLAPPLSQRPANGPTGKENRGDKDQKNTRTPTFTLRYSDTGELIAEGSDIYDLTDIAYLEGIFAQAKGKGTEYGILWYPELRFLRMDPQGSTFGFVDISSEFSTLQNLVLDSLLIGTGVFVAFLVLSIFLSRWAVKPVERAWNQQQQFVADASHELKTPLTVIMTGAEMLKDADLGPEIREKCVTNILETSHRMRSLTEEMLTLAQAENVREEMLGQHCSLSEIAEDAVLSYEPMFYEKGLELREEIAQDITTKGNETQLRQLVDILLDNARKYSLPGTTVLSLKKRGSRHCEISVSNPAEPMSKADLEQIFERFYRVDRARTSGGSYGLGLSIARGIVRRHRGTIKAEQDDGVITFYIRLPMMV